MKPALGQNIRQVQKLAFEAQRGMNGLDPIAAVQLGVEPEQAQSPARAKAEGDVPVKAGIVGVISQGGFMCQ